MAPNVELSVATRHSSETETGNPYRWLTRWPNSIRDSEKVLVLRNSERRSIS